MSPIVSNPCCITFNKISITKNKSSSPGTVSSLSSQVVSSKQSRVGLMQELSFLELLSPLQVTHVWDIFLPLAQTPHRRDHRLLVSLPKDTGKCGVNEIA